jgi:hypothetical protein
MNPKKLKETLSAVSRAAEVYTSARAAIAPAAIAWFTRHGYTTVREAPITDRPLVRVLLTYQQAKDRLQRALNGDSPRPRTRRPRSAWGKHQHHLFPAQPRSLAVARLLLAKGDHTMAQNAGASPTWPRYDEEVALLSTELAHLYHRDTLGIDGLHRALAERCARHRLLAWPLGWAVVLMSSPFAYAIVRKAQLHAACSLRILAMHALQADVTLFLTQRLRVPLRPTSRC